MIVGINKGQLTIVHGKTTEEWQNVLNGLLWSDMSEISGESMGNEDTMEGSPATRIKVYLLESGEAFIIEGQVKSDVHDDGEGVVCVEGRIRLHWRGRWSIEYIRGRGWRRRRCIVRRNRISRTGTLRETRERGQSNMPVRRRHQFYNNRSNQTTTIHL